MLTPGMRKRCVLVRGWRGAWQRRIDLHRPWNVTDSVEDVASRALGCVIRLTHQHSFWKSHGATLSLSLSLSLSLDPVIPDEWQWPPLQSTHLMGTAEREWVQLKNGWDTIRGGNVNRGFSGGHRFNWRVMSRQFCLPALKGKWLVDRFLKKKVTLATCKQPGVSFKYCSLLDSCWKRKFYWRPYG